MTSQHRGPAPFVALIGMDWADQKHDFALAPAGSHQVESGQVDHTPEALHDWITAVHQRFNGPIAIAVELSRGPLINGLRKYDFVTIFPLPPARSASYRDAFSSSGAKDDPVDSRLILDYLQKHPDHLRPWTPDSPETRQLAMLNETRRKLVDLQTGFSNSLTSALKQYFPQALAWIRDLRTPLACDFLQRWPSLEMLQRAKPNSIRKFFIDHRCRHHQRIEDVVTQIATAMPLTNDPAIIEATIVEARALAAQLKALAKSIRDIDDRIERLFSAHADAFIYDSLPGAGAVYAPRLLAAMGDDRGRWSDASQLQSFSGIAPVTIRSGKASRVQRRFACPTFMKQTFHEFAKSSIRFCGWARCYYEQQRQRGAQHHAAVRALAYKWIRIIFRCWRDRVPYDDHRYVQALREAPSPLVKLIDARREKLSQTVASAT